MIIQIEQELSAVADSTGARRSHPSSVFSPDSQINIFNCMDNAEKYKNEEFDK
jgi:hypothetical protein